MKKKISIIGGDLRVVNLAKMLKNEGFDVFTYALEKAENFENIEKCSNLEETIKESHVVISSVPLSKDGIKVNTPYSDFEVTLDELCGKLAGKKFVAGKIDDKFKCTKNIEVFDILDIEEYAILNAIATAEGAIQIAMEEFPKTIFGSNVLVMGFGRIGKILSKMLEGIGANVFCEARKNTDLAYIKGYGYTPVKLEDLDKSLPKFDIIINNIPVRLLDKTKLDLVKKDALIIDLASNPGGVDFEYAKHNNIKTIWALGLPGKVAPVSAAEYIKEILETYKLL